MICFIWPPSITWGPKKEGQKTKGVTLGFCQGNLFANEDEALLAEGRKQVYCMYFNSLKEINDFIEKVYLRRDFSGFKGDRKFVRDDQGQKAFSKLRSSIAGI